SQLLFALPLVQGATQQQVKASCNALAEGCPAAGGAILLAHRFSTRRHAHYSREEATAQTASVLKALAGATIVHALPNHTLGVLESMAKMDEVLDSASGDAASYNNNKNSD
ncbi:unnamed protein product, partial [Polarella glacialis]